VLQACVAHSVGAALTVDDERSRTNATAVAVGMTFERRNGFQQHVTRHELRRRCDTATCGAPHPAELRAPRSTLHARIV